MGLPQSMMPRPSLSRAFVRDRVEELQAVVVSAK